MIKFFGRYKKSGASPFDEKKYKWQRRTEPYKRRPEWWDVPDGNFNNNCIARPDEDQQKYPEKSCR